MTVKFIKVINNWFRLAWVGKQSEPGFWDQHWSSIDLPTLVEDAIQDTVLNSAFAKYLPKNGWILEGGCGLGQWVRVLKDKGYRIIGVEFACQTACRAKACFPDLSIVIGDVESLPLRDRSLSGYISLGVVEHFIDGPDKVLQESYRVLQPGGMLLISVPYLNSIRRIKIALRRYRRLELSLLRYEGFYQYAFDIREFRSILNRNGFQTLALIPYDAKKGLSDEIPFVKRFVNRIASQGGANLTFATVSILQESAKDDGWKAGNWLLKSIGRRIVRTAILRWLAGHMMLYVGRKC